MSLDVVKTLSLHCKVRSVSSVQTQVLISTQKSLRFFWHVLSWTLDHMTFIITSVPSDYLWTTWSLYTRLVKACKWCHVDSLFYFCCYLLKGFSKVWVSARMPSGSPQLNYRMECSCASQGVLQCPVSPGSSEGICCPGLDTAAHSAVREKCQLPQVRVRTGSTPSGQSSKLTLRKWWKTCLFFLCLV